MSGKVHQDCPNSGNLFHECNDRCFERMSSRDVPKKEKKWLGFRIPAWSKETPPSRPALGISGNRWPLPSYYAKRMVESDESPSFSSSEDTFNANLSTPRSPLHGNEADPGLNWLPMSPSLAVYCKKDGFSSKSDHREATIHEEMSSRTRHKTPEYPLRTPQHRRRTPEHESVALGPDTPRTAEHRARNPGPRLKTPEPRGMYIKPPRPRIPQTQPVSHRSLESAGLRSPHKVETRPRTPVETQPRTPVSTPKAEEYRAHSARSPRPQSASSNIGGNYPANASKSQGNKADSVYTEDEKECLLLYPEIQKKPTSTPNRKGYEAPKKHNKEFDQVDESKSINHNKFSFLDGSVYVHSDETARTLYQKPRKLSEKQSIEPPELPDEWMKKAIEIYEAGEETESVISESCVSVGSYKVRASVSATLQQILDKHGDIASNSTPQSLPMKSYFLETLAAVVLELQLTPLNELKENRVLEMLAVVKDVESVKIRAGWLREILNEILEAGKHYDEHKTTVVEKEVCERDVQLGRVELEKILMEAKLKEKEVKDFRKGVMEMAGRLGELEMKRARLEKLLPFLSSKVDKFQGGYLL